MGALLLGGRYHGTARQSLRPVCMGLFSGAMVLWYMESLPPHVADEARAVTRLGGETSSPLHGTVHSYSLKVLNEQTHLRGKE